MESSVERKLRLGVQRLGGLCYKWVSPGNDGVPDRIVMLEGKTWFVELKEVGGRLSPKQRIQIGRMKERGQDVSVLIGNEQVKNFLDEIARIPRASR